MKNTSSLKLLSVLVPLAALLIAVLVIVMQFRRLRSVEDKRTVAARQIAYLDLKALEMSRQPPLKKIPVVPPTPDEQPLFLTMIRNFAATSGVQLAKYENKTLPAPVPGSAEAKSNGLPAGVAALTSSVEVAGDYNAIRLFLYQLMHAPRLYNTVDLKWVNDEKNNAGKWPMTRLTFTLLRYVEAPLPPPPPAGTTPASQDNSNNTGNRS